MPTIKRMKPPKTDIRISRFLNFGTILFGIMLIYIVYNVYTYMKDDDVAVFTVEQSTYDTDFTATGIAIREEELINASSGGTVCYYIRDGEKVGKGANIYSIDSSGSVQSAADALAAEGGIELSGSDYSDISKQIKMFKTGFSSSSFGDIYDFKTSIDNRLLEIYEDMVFDAANAQGVALSAQTAPYSGLVAYYQDGYEDVSVDSLSPELFDKTTYQKQTLKSDGQIAAGSPVCKLINDDGWKIAVSLTEEEYKKVTKNDYATYTINDSSRKIQTLYETIEKDGSYYIVVSFNKYMAQYIDERFLDINFSFDESSGLKIPTSSIVKKDAYMIPVDYLSEGNGDEGLHFNQVTYTEKGDMKVKQISPTIYFSDERFCYVDSDELSADTVLLMNDSDNTFSVATAARYSMDGVLCVSRGTAEFRRIEIKIEGSDYCIVSTGTSYGISMYDRILLDGTSLAEGDVVY